MADRSKAPKAKKSPAGAVRDTTAKAKAAPARGKALNGHDKSPRAIDAVGLVEAGLAPKAVSKIKKICVYCGSGPGKNPAYVAAARTLGTAMAHQGIGLVYGGGSLGLMGETAKAVLDAGGHVTGIIPQFLSDKERMLRDVQDLHVVEDMHTRKRMMFEFSDAFVALPGGIGTLEELVEQLTWAQLGRHTKPIILVNIDGFWEPFLNLLAHMRDEAFIRAGLEVRFVTVNRAEDVIRAAEAVASDDPTSAAVLKSIVQQF